MCYNHLCSLVYHNFVKTRSAGFYKIERRKRSEAESKLVSTDLRKPTRRFRRGRVAQLVRAQDS